MDEFRFENEELNKYMENATGKEKFTKDDIKDKLKNDGFIKLKQTKAIQKDIELISSILDEIKIMDGDLSEIDLSKLSVKKLSLMGCEIPEHFFKNSTIFGLELKSCDLKENTISDIGNMPNLVLLDIKGKITVDKKRIIAENPTFNDLSYEERKDIVKNKKYKIREKIDMEPLRNASRLVSLRLDKMNISFDFCKELKKLRKLEIEDIETKENARIPEIESLETLKVNTDDNNLEIIKNLTNVKKLTLTSDPKIKVDSEILKQFHNLEELEINGITEISDNLPETEKMQNLVLTNCGVEEFDKIQKTYKYIKHLDLSNNPLSFITMEQIKKTKKFCETFEFDNTKLSEELKKNVCYIEDEDIERKIKNILWIQKDGRINAYDLITTRGLKKSTIKGAKMLRNLIKLEEKGLEIENNNILDIENIEELKDDELIKLQQYVTYLKLGSLNGLNAEKMKKIGGNIVYQIEHDQLASTLSGGGYTADNIKEIIDVMELIKSKVPAKASEYTKFKKIYEIIGKGANYDFSGCWDSEKYVFEAENLTRSLKGVLLEGRAVCAGYALALEQVLKYNGIEAKVIGGYAYGKPINGHAWNQVRIDGKWYNADLTWDMMSIKRGEDLEYCLVSDEKFNEEHTATDDVFECKDSYMRNKKR